MAVKAVTSIQSDAADGREVEDSSLEPNMPLPGHAFLTKCGPGDFTVERFSDA